MEVAIPAAEEPVMTQTYRALRVAPGDDGWKPTRRRRRADGRTDNR
jgi:hypothetical protein